MISLIHPSRGRPDKARTTFMKWMNKDPGEERGGYRNHSFGHYISVDIDDPTVGRYKELFGSHTIVSNNKSVVEATNKAALIATYEDQSDDKILVYLSDDFDCPENWVVLIEKEFEGCNEPRMLKVDDCLQKFDVGVLTIPIMNRQLYNLLGYFFNPLYKSMHVDVDLFETTKRFIKYCPHLKFPHDHHSLGKCENDDTYRRSEANWDQGLQVIKQRRRQGFPI